MSFKKRLKARLRGPVFRVLYVVLRPFGKVPVRIAGMSANFRFDSVAELTRVWGLIGEKHVFAKLLRSVEPGDTIWDVGANVGTHSVFLGKKVGNSGKVIAFEPEDKTSVRLQENIDLNHLTNITVAREALGDSESMHTLSVDSRPGSGKHSLLEIPGYQTTTVQVRRGDTLVAEHPDALPSVVKIDVEGFEVEVLKGMEKTLANPRCRLVLCEVHNEFLRRRNLDPASVREMLTEAGFVEFEEFARGPEVHLLARKKRSQ